MDHTPEGLTLKQVAIAAVESFNARFTAFVSLTDPLQAITEAAQLKGRITVLQQIQVFDQFEAMEVRNLVDLTLAALLDQYLTDRHDTAPVRGLVASLRDHILVQ